MCIELSAKSKNILCFLSFTRANVYNMEQRIMRLLVLGNLILHHFAVIHPQPEMQGLGRHYQGIRMCVESCLLTGHCQGVRYDVSSLMCSLQLDEGGTVVTFAQEAETVRCDIVDNLI